MSIVKINEQIAFLRKQKGLTQEELAKRLGVTNQSVSKWESAQCCPDIQLLPAIAELFEVSVDELLGHKATDGLGDICLKIKNYFSDLPEKETFGKTYRIAALLHEVAFTDGYKREMRWHEKDYAKETVASWGLSILAEEKGCTGRVGNGIFFSTNEGYVPPTASQLKGLARMMEQFASHKILKVMYALYGLTLQDEERYVDAAAIAKVACMNVEEMEPLLDELPIAVKEEGGILFYRLERAFYYIPALLTFLVKK